MQYKWSSVLIVSKQSNVVYRSCQRGTEKCTLGPVSMPTMKVDVDCCAQTPLSGVLPLGCELPLLLRLQSDEAGFPPAETDSKSRGSAHLCFQRTKFLSE